MTEPTVEAVQPELETQDQPAKIEVPPESWPAVVPDDEKPVEDRPELHLS